MALTLAAVPTTQQLGRSLYRAYLRLLNSLKKEGYGCALLWNDKFMLLVPRREERLSWGLGFNSICFTGFITCPSEED